MSLLFPWHCLCVAPGVAALLTRKDDFHTGISIYVTAWFQCLLKTTGWYPLFAPRFEPLGKHRTAATRPGKTQPVVL